jgi:hypothetical protein
MQAASLNADERKFMKLTVRKNLDIIKIFPALYPLQSQMMLIQLVEQRDELTRR